MTTLNEIETSEPRSRRHTPPWGRVFAFAIGGLLVGIGIGTWVVHLTNTGGLWSWKVLEGQQHFETIVDATTQALWAETTDGKLYAWNSNCSLELNCRSWVPGYEFPLQPRQPMDMPLERGQSCRALWPELPAEPQAGLRECVVARTLGPDFGVVALYAVLEDGRILSWGYTRATINDIMVPVELGCWGTLVGLGLGALIALMAKPREEK